MPPNATDTQHLLPFYTGPNMSATTSAPAFDSVFKFRVDKHIVATVRSNETVLIPDVPVKRRVKVEVRVDDRPFETFWVDLQRVRDHRICLWLYPGYWHWIEMAWGDTKLGCKCKEPGKRDGG